MAEGQERRRSARLVALDACNEKQVPTVIALPATNTPLAQDAQKRRGRKRRLLGEVVSTSPRVGNIVINLEHPSEIARCENDPPNTDQPLPAISDTKLPEKRVLELVLDILQKRDTHGFFAVPVNPEEVKGYHDIIKDPMDFGTMRAKLQGGLYASLEQFEHDVFLISKNAMRFNASATVFFRQARGIGDLAKRVFQVLRSDPENFENTFSLRKRNYRRRPRGEAGSWNVSGTTTDIASINRPYSLNDPSKKYSQTNPGSSMSTLHVYGRTYYNLPGSGDGRRINLHEVDHRLTCRSWESYLSENESISSTVYNRSEPLVPVNQAGVGYKESLMKFVSDLGPTAQKVASRKLQQCQVQAQSPNSQFLAPSSQVPATSTQQGSTPLDGLISLGTSSYISDKFKKDIGTSLIEDAVHQTPISEIELGAHHRTTGIGDLNLPAVGLTSSSSGHSTMLMGSSKSCSWVEPTKLNAQSRLTSFMSGNNDSCMVSSWPSQEVTDGASLNQPKMVGAQTVLNLSFLQTRLDEINSSKTASGFSREAGPGIWGESGSSRSFQSELSFNAQSSREKTPVRSYLAELGAEGIGLDEMKFNESFLGGRRPSFNALPSQEKSPPVHTHQTELISSLRVPSFAAMRRHGKAPANGLQTELTNSSRGLSFNEVSLHKRSPVLIQQAEPNSGCLGFNTLSLQERQERQERALMHGPVAERGPYWGLYFDEVERSCPELNLVGQNSGVLSHNAPMSSHAEPSVAAVPTFQLNLNSGVLSLNAPMSSHAKPPPVAAVPAFQAVVSCGGPSLNAPMTFNAKLPVAAVPTFQATVSSGGPSLNAPMTFNAKPPVAAMPTFQATVNSGGPSLNAPMTFNAKPPVAAMPTFQATVNSGGPSLNAPMSFNAKPPGAALHALLAELNSGGQSSNAMGIREKSPVNGQQPDLTTLAFQKNQQPSVEDNQLPDLALQL